jgi:undecaprenyl-diphosphatase
MDILKTIIFGIVEGITEFLPISSTGHLIMLARIFNLEQDNFLKSFEIFIQGGAILAVLVLYWRRLLEKEVFKRISIAFLFTALLGISFYKVFKEYLLNLNIVLWALFLGGIFLVIFELFYKEKDESKEEISKISYKEAILIGLFQSLSMIPGVSRAGATIIGGLILGLKRKTIVEFSFLLAIPTMLIGAGFDLYHSGPVFSFSQFSYLF